MVGLSPQQVWRKIPLDHDAFALQRKDPVNPKHIGKICDLFDKHGLRNQLCVVLNHRHFDLEEGEKHVERGNIATPWAVDTAPEYVTSRIVGRTWAFIDGELMPYEYKFCEDPEEKPLHMPAQFIRDLQMLLQDHDLTERLGISLVDESDSDSEDRYEITIGRVNIMVRGNDHPETVGWRAALGSGSSTPVKSCASGWSHCNRCC